MKVANYARLGDLDIEVRRHLVMVGANDVGKSSLLRIVNFTLGASLGQMYQNLSRSDLRDPDQPLVVEAVLGDFSDAEGAIFHREIDINPETQQGSLTVRLDVDPDVDDPDAVVIQRVLTGTAERRNPTREQLAAFGWRYLPATRGVGDAQLGGPHSALRLLLDGIDMGPEKTGLASLLADFNDKLHTSERLAALRATMAGHLAKSMPHPVTSDDLAVRTAADPGASVLEGVSVFLHRGEKYAPLAEQSDGLRQLMALTLFDLAENSANMIAVDEPELHLHPTSQRTVAELFAESANQKIVSTHSPYVLQRFEPSHVLVIAPDSTVHQVPDGALGVVEKLRSQWWSPRLLEALTARYVLAVEGVADRIIVEAAARALGIGLDRNGAVVLELDGAHKFRQVYKLLGKDGFGIHILALVDKEEENIFTGAFGGSPKKVLGTHVWSCERDLEEEYCRALSPQTVGRILIEAEVCRERGLLQACGVGQVEGLTCEAVAEFCRKRKTEAAAAIAEALTPEMAARITSVTGILKRVEELTKQW
ncbi:AAA family ATPase [Streptomyces sp. T-3]|nr:AAA family ATPase [Streptomyces sp. T-3]